MHIAIKKEIIKYKNALNNIILPLIYWFLTDKPKQSFVLFTRLLHTIRINVCVMFYYFFLKMYTKFMDLSKILNIHRFHKKLNDKN